jgi:hypothetical protein
LTLHKTGLKVLPLLPPANRNQNKKPDEGKRRYQRERLPGMVGMRPAMRRSLPTAT